MKKLFYLLLLIPITYSCCKQPQEMAKPKTSVTVVATSEGSSTLEVSPVVSQSFTGKCSTSFEASQSRVIVHVHSDEPCVKTITLFVNGMQVARRAGTCEDTDYELTYTLSSL